MNIYRVRQADRQLTVRARDMTHAVRLFRDYHGHMSDAETWVEFIGEEFDSRRHSITTDVRHETGHG